MNRTFVYLALIAILTSCGWIIGESDDATLASLESSVSLDPTFSPETTEYEATIVRTSITLTAVANNSSAQVLVNVNGGAYTLITGAEDVKIDLGLGESSIELMVVAANGSTTKSYTLVINRVTPVLSYGGTDTQTASGLRFRNTSTSTQSIKSLYFTSLDFGPTGPCFGAIIGGNNIMGGIWSSIDVKAQAEIDVDQNLLYNAMANFLYHATFLVGIVPTDTPGGIASWCVTIGLSTGDVQPPIFAPTSPLIINSISGDASEEVILTCDDTTFTCTASPANKQLFPRL